MTPEYLAAILLRRVFGFAGAPGDVKADVTTALNAVMPAPSTAQPRPMPEGPYGKVVGTLEGARNALELPTSDDIQRNAQTASPWIAQIMAAANNAGRGSPFGSLGGAPPPQSGAPMNITQPAAQGNESLPGLLGNWLTKLQLQQQQPQPQPFDFASP